MLVFGVALKSSVFELSHICTTSTPRSNQATNQLGISIQSKYIYMYITHITIYIYRYILNTGPFH